MKVWGKGAAAEREASRQEAKVGVVRLGRVRWWEWGSGWGGAVPAEGREAYRQEATVRVGGGHGFWGGEV